MGRRCNHEPEATSMTGAPARSSTRGLRVLVIDDDPLVHRMLARSLTGAGHTVKCADCVKEGIRAFTETPFDVVITDIYMPDEDGLDALRQLREIRPSTPVIVLSGQLTDAFGVTLKSVVMSLGAFAAISKATDCHKVLELVEFLAGGGAATVCEIGPSLTDSGDST